MRNKTLVLLIIAALFAAAVFCPAVSARYTADGQENVGIVNGDIIFAGEKNLVVKDLTDGTYTTDYLLLDGTKILLVDGKIINVPEPASASSTCYAINTTKGENTPIAYVTVSKLSTVFDNTQIPTEVKTGVSNPFTFANPGGQNGLEGTKWASMVLKAEDGTILSSVTQDNTLSYKFDKEQTVTLTLDFSLSTIGSSIQASKIYTIKVTSEISSVKLEVPGKLYQGGKGTLKLTGIPNTGYIVTVSSGGITFTENSGTSMPVNVGSYGTANIEVDVAADAEIKQYTFTVYKDSNKLLEKFVTVGTADTQYSVIFDIAPEEARSGIFASGDIITISGSISPNPGPDASFTFYLYLTGHGLSPVNLKKEPVVDGADSTFTVVEFNPELGIWETDWDTRYFEPGMYTIHLRDTPYIYDATVFLGEGCYISQEYSLSHPSIHVKFAEENGGLFTNGDYVYSFWSARGSPDAVRWYIIGPNFLETGVNTNANNWLYTKDQEPGKSAPQGLYGFTYDRFFSNDIAPGNYYLVYQHPGFNREFDVKPNNENGYFTSLTTNFGESASLDGRPSSNCAEALETLINSAASDDLCVITDITIEPPYISIDQVEHLEIGEALKIKGTTNYAGEGVTADGTEVKNTFSLTVNRLDFDLAEENAAMKLQIVNRVVPQNVIPYYGERTYAFDEIDTATWFEGTYQATVTNIDTGFSESIMFTVGGDGVEQDSATLQVPSDPLAEPYEELDPLPPIIDYSEPVEPEEPKSPGFLLTPLALAAAFALRRK